MSQTFASQTVTSPGDVELEKICVVCGPASAQHLGVKPGTIIDPDEQPELYARHQDFAQGEVS